MKMDYDIFGISGLPKRTEEHPPRDETGRLLHQLIFSKKEGRKLWDLLIKEYLINTPVADFTFSEAYSRYREGQNSMLRILQKRSEIFLQQTQELNNKGD